MKKIVDELTERIKKLYASYEKFMWHEANRNLAIIFGKNRVITFYLYEDGELADELSLTFEDKEYDVYKALCLNIFIMALGNVYIHTNEDDENKHIYYNNQHKPYQAIISDDDSLNSILDSLVAKQDTEFINSESPEVKNVVEGIKPKRYSRKFLNQLDQRIKISREMLKWR